MQHKPKFISIEGLFPRLYKSLPGYLKGVIHCVTAGTGVGKTKFTKFAFLLHGYQYCKANNMPFYAIWFALEEDEETFWISLLCDLMFERYGLSLTYYQYNGYHEGRTEEHDRIIKELLPEIEEMKKVIKVVDYVSNPTGIYKTIQKFMEPLGVKKEGIVDQDEFGNKWSSFEFIYHNPDTQVMVIIDHMTLVTSEKNKFADADTKHKAIGKLSEYFVKFIAKKYLTIPVIIQQQVANTGSAEDLKMGRAEPTLDKLGVNKEVQQEYQVVLGLFNPQSCTPSIDNYGGYNTKLFGSHFRSCKILKHRKGDNDGKSVGMYFHGATNKYEELPPAVIKQGERLITNPELETYYINN